MIRTTHFGTLGDGRTVEAHQISNTHGASATIITWGGIVTSLRMPDRTGRIDDVVLGFDRLESYLAGHPYFGAITGRVAGEGCGTIENHELQVDSNLAIELDEGLTPLGRTSQVEGRAGDFLQSKRLGDAIPGLFQGHGDLYLIPRTAGEVLVRIARALEPGTGRVMEVSTTQTCMQLYTSSHFTDPIAGKSGKTYSRFSGLCFECEGYPDAINTPGFGDILVRPGRPQRHTTVYAFSVC